MKKLKILLTGLVAATVVASLLIERRSQAKFSENDALFGQQENQVARLAAENERLSNQIVKANAGNAERDDRAAELAQLRARVEALREQRNHLAKWQKQLTENRRITGTQFFHTGDFNLLEHNHETRI